MMKHIVESSDGNGITDAWHCECGHTPCDGLDCGVYLPGRKPRLKRQVDPAAYSAERRRAWETRREKYGASGHSGRYAR